MPDPQLTRNNKRTFYLTPSFSIRYPAPDFTHCLPDLMNDGRETTDL